MTARINFGWLPQIPDRRDIPLKTTMKAEALPTAVNLMDYGRFPVVYDQGDLGSCVANAVAAAIEYEQYKQHMADGKIDFLEADREFTPSRLFIYYGARAYLGTEEEDSGSMIRDAMRVVYNVGAPRETGWKYDPDKFTIRPPERTYKSAPYHKITGYRAVPVNVIEVKKALAEKLAVVVGMSVYESFFDGDRTGDVPMPGDREALLGGHAVLLTGYNDAKQRFTFRNSWGAAWGNKGYGTLPYAYVGDRYLGADYWALIDTQYKERFAE